MATAKRPFWMHQLVEYLLGGALLATGLQSPTPAMPSIVGGIIVFHGAITKGALAAFQWIPRRLHRAIDPVIILLEIVAGVQPVIDVESGTRLIMVGIALAHAFVWWQSSFLEKPSRRERKATKAAEVAARVDAGIAPPPLPDDRSTEIGRTAGRVAANGVKFVKRKKAERDQRR